MIPRTARPSRRSVVAGVASAGLVSGCAACSADGGPAPADRKPAPPPPGTAQRTRAAAESLALLGRYDATLAAHPGLHPLLGPLRAEVAQHVTAFGGRLPQPGPATAGRTGAVPPDPSASGGTASPKAAAATTAPPAPPASPAAAVTALAAAERDVAARRTADLAAAPGDLARLLASVAACAAGHGVLLAAGAKHA